MKIVLNGKDSEIKSKSTLLDLIQSKDLNKDRIIIQVNEEIIKKDNFNDFEIIEDSKIEILSIVGGG